MKSQSVGHLFDICLIYDIFPLFGSLSGSEGLVLNLPAFAFWSAKVKT